MLKRVGEKGCEILAFFSPMLILQLPGNTMAEKMQNEKSLNFPVFRPEFCAGKTLRTVPETFEDFCALFRGKWGQPKIH